MIHHEATSNHVSQAPREVEEALTKTVLAPFADTDNPRLEELMESLVMHLKTCLEPSDYLEASTRRLSKIII